MRAILLIGLGFGDEGKGGATDSLCRDYNADLVIRFNGGHQAGHRVQLDDGRSHVFSQFGSGTFAGARTYHTRHSMIEPGAMHREAKALGELGVRRPFDFLSVSEDCLVTPKYLKLLNRVRERVRGLQSGRHGSCGLGIGETKRYYLRYGSDSIFAGDLKGTDNDLWAKLELMRQRVFDEISQLTAPNGISPATSKLVGHRPLQEILQQLGSISPLVESKQMRLDGMDISISASGYLPSFKTVIFEGAQGLLLDEMFGFHPYTTWSTMTYKWALECLQHCSPSKIDVVKVGVTRAYHTRHGAGPFPTEDANLSKRLSEAGNQPNNWQGTLRYGHLDMTLLKYAIQVANPDYLIVNHMDQYGAPIAWNHTSDCLGSPIFQTLQESEMVGNALRNMKVTYESLTAKAFLEHLGSVRPVAITSHGPTHRDRVKKIDLFANSLCAV